MLLGSYLLAQLRTAVAQGHAAYARRSPHCRKITIILTLMIGLQVLAAIRATDNLALAYKLACCLPLTPALQHCLFVGSYTKACIIDVHIYSCLVPPFFGILSVSDASYHAMLAGRCCCGYYGCSAYMQPGAWWHTGHSLEQVHTSNIYKGFCCDDALLTDPRNACGTSVTGTAVVIIWQLPDIMRPCIWGLVSWVFPYLFSVDFWCRDDACMHVFSCVFHPRAKLMHACACCIWLMDRWVISVASLL